MSNFILKVTMLRAPEAFELMTYRFVYNAVTHCAMLIGNKFWKKYKFYN